MTRPLIALLALSLLTACASDPQEQAEVEPAAPPPAAASPAFLETPYTAEQIRDAWVPGLSLKMVNETQYGKQYQRWTVVSADDEGADVEYAEIDAQDNRMGEPQVRRSLWVELRDHARFPADVCTRTEVTRQTALGELTGWSYVLSDEANDVVTEFFFAHSLPGAPVHMVVTRAGAVMQEMTQEERDLLPPS